MLLRKEREDGMSIYALPEVAENLRTICSLTLGPKENSVIGGPLCIEAVRDGEAHTVAGREITFFDIHSLKAPQFGFSCPPGGRKTASYAWAMNLSTSVAPRMRKARTGSPGKRTALTPCAASSSRKKSATAR